MSTAKWGQRALHIAPCAQGLSLRQQMSQRPRFLEVPDALAVGLCNLMATLDPGPRAFLPRLAERVAAEGRACVLIVNKWDAIQDKVPSPSICPAMPPPPGVGLFAKRGCASPA